MNRIDQLHLEWPFAGDRTLHDLSRQEASTVGRKPVSTLMKKMGLEALYSKPKTPQRDTLRTKSIHSCFGIWWSHGLSRHGLWTIAISRWLGGLCT